jgi:hypothetical protein
MGLLKFVDAAYPSGITGGPYDGVAFYIGGDTPHIWSHAEIEARPERYRLPVFTRSNPQTASPSADVRGALAQLASIGAPKGSLVGWDSETSVDPSYIQSVYMVLLQGGYKLLDYGSLSTVFGNKNPDGYYWTADWIDKPIVNHGAVMTQEYNFAGYDASSAQSGLPFWDTRPATPGVPPQQKEEDMPAGQVTNQAFIPFPPGAYKSLWLLSDEPGETVDVTIRVAQHSKAKGWAADMVSLTTSNPHEVTFTETDTDGVSLIMQTPLAVAGYSLA